MEALTAVAEAATVPWETIHAMPFTVRAVEVVSALRSVEGFATRVRAEAGLPAPVEYVAGH